MAISNEQELTTQEAAELLGLSPNTLKKWRHTKEQPNLHWRKRFRKVFYLKSEVLCFKHKSTYQTPIENLTS